jgi:CPA2 family monovalent cation:H+ antiporter-2
MKIKRNILIGGALQVVLTIAVFYLLSQQMGYSYSEALFIGFLASLSSTAIILNILQKSGRVNSPEGKVVLSILIFQDLAIVPMMIFTPILAGQTDSAGSSIIQLSIKVIILMALVIVLTRWLVPFLMHQIARTRIRELFLISIILLCAGIVLVTYLAGLSLALGAFLAGLIISESEYNHQALGNITPFKDIFSSFFFVSIGMMLDLSFLIENLIPVLVVIFSILIIKIITGALSALALKYPMRIAMITGFMLFQVGEFSLILSKTGIEHGLISGHDYQVFLAAAVVMMAFTPLVMRLGPSAGKLLAGLPLPRWMKRDIAGEEGFEKKFENHIIIIGYGLVGRNIVRAAKIADIPYVIVEMNPETVKQEKENGEPIFYGDSTNEEVLVHAGIKKARTVVVAISDPTSERRITQLSSELNPAAYLIIRTRYVNETAPLTELGADEVIPEEYETSIEIFALVLAKYMVPSLEIERFIKEIRSGGYSALRPVSNRSVSDRHLKFHLPDYEILTFRIEENSPIAGRKLSEMDFRGRYDANVLAIRRGEDIIPNPPADTVFSAEDVLILFGDARKMLSCRELFYCK